MRWTLTIIGAIMIAVGGVWIAQGTGVLPGSVMSGQSFWAIVGAIVLVIGLGLLLFGARRRTV
jgi:hypothetical protein